MYTLEMCAGGGGQALGLHNAGFKHRVLIENDEHACKTLEYIITKITWVGEELLKVIYVSLRRMRRKTTGA